MYFIIVWSYANQKLFYLTPFPFFCFTLLDFKQPSLSEFFKISEESLFRFYKRNFRFLQLERKPDIRKINLFSTELVVFVRPFSRPKIFSSLCLPSLKIAIFQTDHVFVSYLLNFLFFFFNCYKRKILNRHLASFTYVF